MQQQNLLFSLAAELHPKFLAGAKKSSERSKAQIATDTPREQGSKIPDPQEPGGRTGETRASSGT